MATNSNLIKDPDANAINMAPDRTQAPLDRTPMRARDVVDEQFPATYEKFSSKDPVKIAKLQMQTAPGVTPFGQLRATEDDFKWLQQKREAEELANFDQWFAHNFDMMSPAQKAMAKELYPSFYERRMKLLDKQVELTREIAKLKLNGIQNENDLKLQYAMEKGIIDEDPLVNILHPEKSNLKNVRSDRFERGLLSRKAYPRGNWGLRARPVNATNITGRNIMHPASVSGVGGRDFSVYDTVTSVTERYPANNSLLRGVLPPQAPANQAPVNQAPPVVPVVNEFEAQAGRGVGFGQVPPN